MVADTLKPLAIHKLLVTHNHSRDTQLHNQRIHRYVLKCDSVVLSRCVEVVNL